MKFKIIEEYEKFYLAQAPNKYYECFLKVDYKPDEEGYINKKLNDFEGHDIDPEKVNRNFNPSIKFRN